MPDIVGDAEVVLIPVGAAEPIGLAGPFAALWLRLVDGPVPDSDLTDAERTLVREYRAAGMATDDVEHPDRIRTVSRPWLDSLFHEIVYALVSHLAAQSSVEVVFIKGPVLQRQGLRSPRHSGDVDVWVDPRRIMQLADLLERAGWKHLNDKWERSPLYHSVTMVPGDWGCEVDLHRHVPGFGVPDADLFELLRKNSELVTFAGVSVRVPKAPAHAVIAALHLTRPEEGRRASAIIEGRAARTLTAAGPAALAFCKESGAGPALRSVLEQAFPDRELCVGGAVPLNWEWRAEADRARRYFIVFRSSPAREWPLMAYRSLWPNARMAVRIERVYGASTSSPLVARFRRLKRGIAQQLRATRST